MTPTFAPITSVAQQYGGTAELPAAQQAEIAYLSWGATADRRKRTRPGSNGIPYPSRARREHPAKAPTTDRCS